jgi:hypothetical protein
MHRYLIFFSLSSISLIVLGINRGFDFSDEGLYLFVADPALNNSTSFLVYDLFFKLLHKISSLEIGILELRILRILGTIVSAAALTGFWNAVTFGEKSTVPIFWVSLLGLFCSYAFLPPTLSYNSLSLFITCFWLFFLTYSFPNWLNSLMIAGLLVCLLYIKAPVAALLILITIILKWKQENFFILFSVFLILCLTVWESLFYFLFEDGLILRIQNISAMQSLRPSYQMLSLIKSTGVGLFWIACAAFPFYLISFLNQKFNRKASLLLPIAFFIIIGIGYITHITAEWNHLVLLAMAALIGYAIGKTQISLFKHPHFNTLLLLLCLPFVLHFGSNVYWLRLGIYFIVFWILALALLDQAQMPRFSLVLGSLTLILVGVGVWVTPFEQEPLWKANRPWKFGNDQELYITDDQHRLLQNLKGQLNKHPNQTTLSAYRNPGMLLLLDHKSPFGYGLWEKSEWTGFLNTYSIPEVIVFHAIDDIPVDLTDHYEKTLIQNYQGADLYVLWK